MAGNNGMEGVAVSAELQEAAKVAKVAKALEKNGNGTTRLLLVGLAALALGGGTVTAVVQGLQVLPGSVQSLTDAIEGTNGEPGLKHEMRATRESNDALRLSLEKNTEAVQDHAQALRWQRWTPAPMTPAGPEGGR